MRWALGALIVLGASAGMIAAILRVRRRAPEGGYFTDGDRASGVFGVLSTGFALLLGFVIFLAFTKYDESRAGAEAEALAVVQLFETAQLMPAGESAELAGEVECYGRSVVNLEWPAMEAGAGPGRSARGGCSMFRHAPDGRAGDRRRAERLRRLARADQCTGGSTASTGSMRRRGSFPCRCGSCCSCRRRLVLVYVLFFADSGERAVVQGLMAGSVTAVVVASLLVLSSLNRPYDPDVGGIRPVAMQRSLEIIGSARVALDLDEPLPCDAVGRPL